MIKYLTLSDIHLGHRRTKTREIIKELDRFFDDFKSTSQFIDLDIIFIAGDLFDTLLDFSSEDIHEIQIWLSRLMGFCSRFNIKLRILEGTPSHDWKQSEIANTLAKVLELPLDFKYIDTLYIEQMSDINLSVLYVPDEWNSNSDTTFSQVQDLMSKLNISQIDIGIMHGMFHYQIPNVPNKAIKHSEANYLSIIKYFINIGHIHSYSTCDRILAQGSFSRISHGEEEPKGAIVCILDEHNGNSFNFIENRNAKIYKTIEVRNRDLDTSLTYISKQLKNIPDDSYIRIKAKKDHPVYIAFEELKMKFVNYNFSKISLDDEEDKLRTDNLTAELNQQYIPITITKDNIVFLLEETIKNKYSLNNGQLKLLSSILESTV